MNTSFFVSPNFVLIECIINPSASNTQAKNPFGTQKQLQNRKVIALETYSDQDIQNSPISVSNPVIPFTIFNTSFLTLYRASVPASQDGYPAQTEGLYYDQVPLSSLRRVGNMANVGLTQSFSRDLFRVMPAEMSWTKSQVTCLPAVPITIPYSALFGVHYLNEHENWKPYAPGY